MKIVLINPVQKDSYGRMTAPIYPPLGLGYLASVLLRKGHSVDILDMEARKTGEEDFKKWLLQESPDIVKFHILKPFPATSVYKELVDRGLIDDFNYEHFGIHTGPIHHLPGLSRTDIERWQKVAYRLFYLRPMILFRQIIRLRSFYRLRTNLRVGLQLFKTIVSD